MSIIRIFANDIELNFKKDSLTIKKENNALSQDFKVTHSSFPFLIIDDENCKKALGSSDITSTTKKKIIPVTVLEFGVKYYGELQQITVVKGFRKCNLKYSSDVLSIINKKISEFMPVISVIPGETSPENYTEEASDVITGSDNWETFPVSMIGQIYPDVKFQFPTMYWKNKFGVDLDPEHPWYNYQNHINNFGENELEETIFLNNTGEVDGSTITINQPNVPSPQVFLLSPLYYIFQYLNWNIEGDFTTHELIKRLLLLSTKDNLSKVLLSPTPETISFDGVGWVQLPADIFGQTYFRKRFYHNITISGRYKFIANFELEPRPPFGNFIFPKIYLFVDPPGSGNGQFVFYRGWNFSNGQNIIIEAEVEIDVTSGNSRIDLLCSYPSRIITSSLEYLLLNTEKEYSQMHPTIELGRYVPDWTVGNYLNYLKNQFNLDISLDDFSKKATFNLNENIENVEIPEVLDKSLVLKSFNLTANTSFVLKYENDEDEALFITREEVVLFDNQDDDFTQKIETKFKFVPRNGYTAELSEDLEDKDGIGLMIYDPVNAPFISEESLNGFNLNIPGEKGIYETFFRRWLKFRLTASGVELEGKFTEIEIQKIYKAKSIYIDNQRYRIDTIEYNETTNNYYVLKFILESVNY